MKRETGNEPARPPDSLPSPIPEDLAADRTRCVLDDSYSSSSRDLEEAGQVAGHPELMDRQDCLRAWTDRFVHACRIDVESLALNVHEDRRRAAVPHGVRRRDEGMADGHDLVAGGHTASTQRQV